MHTHTTHSLIHPHHHSSSLFAIQLLSTWLCAETRYNYPEAPKLLSVSGCAHTGDYADSAADCPTVGGVEITLRGTGFLPPLAVLVNGQSCSVNTYTTTIIYCQLPAGAGLNQSVPTVERELHACMYVCMYCE